MCAITAVLACILLVWVPGCSVDRRPLNVMIIGVDTLRPDHLGCYGYARDTSPSIDRLAAEGVLFENVFSQSPWTLPSFATVFTSLYPMQHGAWALNTKLRTDIPTLPMMLHKRGYSTAGIINAPFLSPDYNVDRGFEYYDYSHPIRSADAVTADALAYLDNHIDEPFFVFVHYFDPHTPYAPPQPYDKMFYPEYKGGLWPPFSINVPKRARTTDFCMDVLQEVRAGVDEATSRLSAEDWEFVRALYDGEIAFTDKAIGELLDGVEERGLRENTLVIFLSDHGEEFYEHQGFEHGHTLYNEVIKVPLIISFPGLVPEGVKVDECVRLIDIAPTVLDYVDIEPSVHLEGTSIRPLLEGKGPVTRPEGSLLPPGVTYSESMLYGTERKCVVAYPWKCVYDIVTADRQLFNLISDPAEEHDLAADDPETLKSIEDILAGAVLGVSETWYVELSGGDLEHEFNIGLGAGSGNIYLARAFDSRGRMLDAATLPHLMVSPAEVSLTDLALASTFTLALKFEKQQPRMRFHVSIDGDTAPGNIYLGRDLANPTSMPFTVNGQTAYCLAPGQPEERPEAPYVLIWRSVGGPGGGTAFELNEDIETRLRAVGYLR